MNSNQGNDSPQQQEVEKEGAERQSQRQHRVIKRIRQACTNCRQKKIKCSGDRPCKLCTKSSQHCTYHAATEPGERPRRASMINQYDTLPSRVSMIESKLTEVIKCIQGSGPQVTDLHATAIQSLQPLGLDGMDFDGFQSDTNSGEKDHSVSQTEEQLWTTIPPQPVLEAAVDAYFLHCHNQPYSYFHEDTFRQKLAEGSLPEYLLFAFLATAIRFLEDPYYQNMQAAAVDAYANASWKSIISHQLTQEDGMDLQIVQAANLLAVIDFTASRLRLAWMKIGLAVRIAQDLQLMYEPDASMSYIEQEERRRVFWSVYLLDKLVSCGRARPPAVLNADCRVLLPCHEPAFRQGIWQKSQTIEKLLDESANLAEEPSPFALTISMASLLGSCARYSLHECNANDDYPPWDSRSDFARITSSLMCFESYTDSSKDAVAAKVSREFTVNGVVDNQRTGQLIFAHALYHLSQCLLYHPFLLRKRLEKFSRNAPGSFLSTAFQTCIKHSGMLSSILKEAIDSNCLVETSFYGYCLTVSSTIHCLFLSSSDEAICQMSSQNLQLNLEMLGGLSKYWNHAPLMSAALIKFQAETSRYSSLIAMTASIDRNLSAADTDNLWSLVDYGVMSKAASPAIMYSQAPVTEWSPSTWLDTGEVSDTHLFGNSMMSAESLGGQNYSSEEFGLVGPDFTGDGAAS